MTLVPFMSDRLSLGSGASGSSPHGAAAQRHFALAEERRREVGEGGQVAARPDGSLLGDSRQQPLVEKFAESLEEFGAHPRVPLGERDQTNRHHRSRLVLLEDSPRTAAVKAHQVDRKFAAQVRWDRRPRAGADTGRHSVDGAAVGFCALHGGARIGELLAVARIVVERDASLAPGDREHVADRAPAGPDDRQRARVGGPRAGCGGAFDAHRPAV
jgi:hypothetical protein